MRLRVITISARGASEAPPLSSRVKQVFPFKDVWTFLLVKTRLGLPLLPSFM